MKSMAASGSMKNNGSGISHIRKKKMASAGMKKRAASVAAISAAISWRRRKMAASKIK